MATAPCLSAAYCCAQIASAKAAYVRAQPCAANAALFGAVFVAIAVQQATALAQVGDKVTAAVPVALAPEASVDPGAGTPTAAPLAAATIALSTAFTLLFM